MAFTPLTHTFGVPLTSHGVATSGVISTVGANLIVIAIADSFWGSHVLSDSKSNTWVPLTAYSNTDKSRIWLYYCVNPVTDGSHTFLATPTGDCYPSL